MNDATPGSGTRLDKWLWAARFYRTRALAVEAIDRGWVMVNGQACKRARMLHLGDMLQLRQGGHGELKREVQVLGLSEVRGPAPVARQLYQETAESMAAAEAAARERRYQVEPAHAIEQGRPTKRDRRELAEWQRWSASVDD